MLSFQALTSVAHGLLGRPKVRHTQQVRVRLQAATVALLAFMVSSLVVLLVPSHRALAQTTPPSLAASGAAPSGLIPAISFYGQSDFQSVKLSPSGRFLAVQAGLPTHRVGLVELELEGGATKPAVVANYSDADVGFFAWVNDERLVYSLADNLAGGGEQRFAPGLFSVTRDGKATRQLIATTWDFVRHPNLGRPPLELDHRLLHPGPGTGDEVVVGRFEWGHGSHLVSVDAMRLNVSTGRTSNLSSGAPRRATAWLFNRAGEPKLIQSREDGRVSFHWKDDPQAAWRLVASANWDALPYVPVAVDAQGHLYVKHSQGRNAEQVLSKFDVTTGQVAGSALVVTPGFDFAGQLVFEREGGPLLGIRVQTDAQTTVWFQEHLKALQAQADARWPGKVNLIQCSPCEPAQSLVAVVRSYSDQDPGQYWLYSAKDQGFSFIGRARRAINPAQMGQTDMERVPTRDGLSMPVWITRPKGAQGPTPTVLLVHGGPWVRGRYWTWEADAQFLASRGYTVIEPEFRGSSGYGARHLRAGWGQWGRKMQDDLIDALDWAQTKGLADKKKVCIAGASYGGYAALMGLARDGSRFACGAAWIAVTDPRLLFSWRHGGDTSEEARQYDLPLMIGKPDAGDAFWDEITPVKRAKDIKAPLLLAFGELDSRVPIVHGKRMREALAEAGHRDLQWVTYPGEAHGWFKVENRLDFALRLEAFLATHLKP